MIEHPLSILLWAAVFLACVVADAAWFVARYYRPDDRRQARRANSAAIDPMLQERNAR